jgi:predicted esterase
MTKRGIVNPYSHIYIGGVGQGATMALYYAMNSK